MQRTPTLTTRGLLIVFISIIAIGSTFAVTTILANNDPKTDEVPEKITFKKMVMLKTLEEFNRWHSNGTIREKDTAVANTLKAYWKLGGLSVNDQQLGNGSWQYAHPWSAVFISWVMLQAGAGTSFPYANAHAKYIVWARDNAKTQEQPLFAAYDICDARSAWPEPGDLVCMNRKRNRFTLNSINEKSISHCDIVVEVNKEQGYLVSIGGNVGQTVNKRIVWLDENGFIDTSKNYKVLDEEDKNPEGSQKEIFGIIRINNNY
jgi:hypothetical protein